MENQDHQLDKLSEDDANKMAFEKSYNRYVDNYIKGRIIINATAKRDNNRKIKILGIFSDGIKKN